MPQPHCSPFTTGAALACVGVVAIATLVPPPEVQLAPSPVVTDVVSLAADAADKAFQDLPNLVHAVDPGNPASLAGLGDLWPLFAPLASLVESTWLASVLLVEAFASLNPLQILLAIVQFPVLALGPPLVTIVDDLTGNGLAADGLGAMAATPGLDDVVGQLSDLTLPSDLGLDVTIP